MYGRLLKAVDEDTLQSNNTPAFARYGYAVKLGYCPNGDEYVINIFKAWDELGSINALPLKTDLKPKSNLAISGTIVKKIANRVSFTAEFASTAINADTRIIEKSEKQSLFNATRFLHKTNVATTYVNAYKANFYYTGKSYGIGSTYERVNPGYETLGAYYFTNDFENITIDFTKRLLNETLNISGRIGYQRNDIDGSKLSSTKKIVGNINAGYSYSKNLNLNLVYSNFTGYTHIRNNFEIINQTNPYENIDTLNYTQINQTINGNVAYIIGNINNKDKQQTINVNINVQQASQEQGKEKLPGTVFYNANIAYNHNIVKAQAGVFCSLNANYNKIPEIDNSGTLGPTVGANKNLFDKKLKLSGSLSYNTSTADNLKNQVWVFRNTGSYTLKEKHQFNISFIIQNRMNKVSNRITDFTLTFGYKFNFNISYNELFK